MDVCHMDFFAVRQVREFIDALDMPVRTDVEIVVDLLKKYGHGLSMPYAKPIAGGLWELRKTGRPQIRILYGFCHNHIVLVHALKKQRSGLGGREIRIGRERLAACCAEIAHTL